MATDTTTDTTGKDTGPNERNISKIPDILPRERVFPIQIGGELFMLSGASISSDGGCLTLREDRDGH
jgi:replication factor C subunit 3/5